MIIVAGGTTAEMSAYASERNLQPGTWVCASEASRIPHYLELHPEARLVLVGSWASRHDADKFRALSAKINRVGLD